MIFLSETYRNRPILSLRTGGAIGYAYGPIINTQNLKIEGWHSTAYGEDEAMFLPVSELRDTIAKGFVVNDHDAITPHEDMIRLKSVIEASYDPVGKVVETEEGTRIGKVKDYAVDNKSLFIKKIYVNQSLLRSLSSFSKPQAIIDRSQIMDVTEDKIVVREAVEKVQQSGPAAVGA